MRVKPPPAPRTRDMTTALMDIVFLMLIFFLLAGTVAPPEDRTVSLAESFNAENATPQQLIYIYADGSVHHDGHTVSVDALAPRLLAAQEEGERVKIGADRELPAQDLIDILSELRVHGVTDITLVTQRAAQ